MHYIAKKTFEQVKHAKGRIIVQVRDNQKYLRHKLNKASRLVKPVQTISTSEKSHGRIETRAVRLFDLRKHIKTTKNWDGWDQYIVAMAVVDRTTEVFNHATRQWKIINEQSIYALNYIDDVTDIASRIRGHWGIESNNYVRDETMFEDYSRIRKAPKVFAILRSWVLNILYFNQEKNIREALYRNCCSIKRALAYLMR